MAEINARPPLFSGLSTRLIAMIVLVILALEVVIFLPSLANARANWLNNRLDIAAVALRVIDAVPADMAIPAELADNLLSTAGASAIALRSPARSQLIERSDEPMPHAAITADVRRRDPFYLMTGGLDTLFNGSDRMLRIIGPANIDETDVTAPADEDGQVIEVIMSEAPLRAELITYARNIFLLSLTIAILTAAVLFFFINRDLIRPIKRMTDAILAYRKEPENASLIIVPSHRKDEIGMTERELAAMQTDLFAMLRQRRHLADLGLAVAKINHDLRNTLTSAQLLSDQVANLDDPNVQRLAPRLVHTLDRAIGFAQSVLSYGRESAVPPKPQPVDLRALLDEVQFEAGLRAHPEIRVDNQVPDEIMLRLDPDQMARVFTNLAKNAREALEPLTEKRDDLTVTFSFAEDQDWLIISVSDNGPGLPPRARDNLFVAFEGSARAEGTGLGLAIARELTEAHGGEVVFVDQEKGTRFDVRLPASLLI
ncbi:MAG: sensor histidine kinase [Hyphomicrobiaceae bacterium]|nr:sensor histidine kinase [Hyphomicrobiaceae bacterium]MCC0022656.1 sensor histidine kinase [Hyphomicrobiaceae bacterium]